MTQFDDIAWLPQLPHEVENNLERDIRIHRNACIVKGERRTEPVQLFALPHGAPHLTYILP